MTKGPEALNIESPGLVHKIQSSPFIKSNTCSLKSTGRARKYVEWQIIVSPEQNLAEPQMSSFANPAKVSCQREGKVCSEHYGSD